jgi:hypothetical protein
MFRMGENGRWLDWLASLRVRLRLSWLPSAGQATTGVSWAAMGLRWGRRQFNRYCSNKPNFSVCREFGFAGRGFTDLKTEGDTPGQALASASVDAGGAGDLGLSAFLGARGRESASLEALGP